MEEWIFEMTQLVEEKNREVELAITTFMRDGIEAGVMHLDEVCGYNKRQIVEFAKNLHDELEDSKAMYWDVETAAVVMACEYLQQTYDSYSTSVRRLEFLRRHVEDKTL